MEKVKLTRIVDGKIQFRIGDGYKDLIDHCSNETCSAAWLYNAVVRLAELEHGKVEGKIDG